MKKITKITGLVLLGIVLGASASVLAATWQGTGWVRDGSIIDAQKMKESFDYLKTVKVDKPPICFGESSVGRKVLQYNESGWVCAVYPIPISGECGDSANSCISGSFIRIFGGGDAVRWKCAGKNGGATVSCAEYVGSGGKN